MQLRRVLGQRDANIDNLTSALHKKVWHANRAVRRECSALLEFRSLPVSIPRFRKIAAVYSAFPLLILPQDAELEDLRRKNAHAREELVAARKVRYRIKARYLLHISLEIPYFLSLW